MSSTNPSIVLICCTQRSLSTIFLRICMNAPMVKIYNDPFSIFFIGEVVNGCTTKSIDEWFEEFDRKIHDEISQGYKIIVKDMSFIMLQHFNSQIEKWIQKNNPKLLHLARHPKARFISFKKGMDGQLKQGKFTEECYSYHLNLETYSFCWQMYEKYGGKILVSEELQSNSKTVFEKSFKYFDIEFDEKYLKYEPMEIPEEMKYFEIFYKTCFESTCFQEGKTDVDSIVIEDSYKDMVESSMEFYNKFVNSTNQIQMDS